MFDATDGDSAITALCVVLSRVPGIRSVYRRPIEPELVSYDEMPCVIVQELGTDYPSYVSRNGRVQGGRTLNALETLALDVQFTCSESEDALQGLATLARERRLFAKALYHTLVNNPTLNLADPFTGEAFDGDLPLPAVDDNGDLIDYCIDCARSFEAAYEDEIARYPTGRVLISLQMQLTECVDGRPRVVLQPSGVGLGKRERPGQTADTIVYREVHTTASESED